MGLLHKKFAAANINMVAVKQVLAFKESISYDGEHSLYKKMYKSVWLWVIISIAQPKKKKVYSFLICLSDVVFKNHLHMWSKQRTNEFKLK